MPDLPGLRLAFVLATSLALALACAEHGSPADPTGPSGGASGEAGAGGVSGNDGGAGASGATPVDPDFLRALASIDDFAALAATGAEVKYLASTDGAAVPEVFDGSDCLFQNTGRFSYHLQFLRTFAEFHALTPIGYEDLVLRRASRVMWGGSVKLFLSAPHPNGGTGVTAFTVYAGATASEALTVEDIVEVDRKLKACAPFLRDRLVWSPDGSSQLAQLAALAEPLAARGVAAVAPALLRPDLRAEAYSDGEGYGYLKLVEGDAAPRGGPRDILVCDAAPNDLSLVAGLLTVQPQSFASHLNLRLRERGVPSASVPSVFQNSLVRELGDRLVHLTVSADGVVIEPAQLEDAMAFWQANQPNVGQPEADLETAELRTFDALGAADALAYGTKAANLGELHAILAAHNRVEGFAIPFRVFADFVHDTGLDAEIEELLGDPRIHVDATHKRARLSALRQSFRSRPLSEQLRSTLRAAVEDAYGVEGLATRLRFRSSTNAEDLPGLSGAGLYDSSSGCIADDLDADSDGPSACLTAEHAAYLRAELDRRLAEIAAHPERTYLRDISDDLAQDLSEEKSAEGALRRVWASLWSERAFDDRAYYGIDHRRVFMGVAVHPTFVGEQLEAVVLTNLEPEADEQLYRVVSQIGEIGVAEPVDPTATPEVLSFQRDTSDRPRAITLVSPSSLAPAGQRLWSDAALLELASALFAVQDHFESAVYPEIAPLRLDIEVDIASDGRVVLKQARPYTPAF